MALRLAPSLLAAAALPMLAAPPIVAQVFVVGEKTATADITTDFHPTRIELPTQPMDELGRRELVRDLEAEQGFAHRALPLGDTITLMANGTMSPQGEAYREMIFKKGQSAAPGDRVAITTVTVKADRVVLDINGGRYLKHRLLRHIELDDMPLVPQNGEQVTGFRIDLVFEGGVPEISAPQVKALLDPIIDFGVKTSNQAYADVLPEFLKSAIDHHDVLVGMNRRMVLATAGAPESKIRELEPGSQTQHYEEWIYGKVPQTVRFVRIENDRVVQVKIAELGKPIVVKTENEMQGYLDPVDTREIAMGDRRAGDEDESRPAGPPPTLREPGDPAPAGASAKVHFPDEEDGRKAEPLPPAPGSPADASSAPPIPGAIPVSDPGQDPAGPATRVN